MNDEQFSADDLTPRERIVFIASCRLADVETGDEREALFYDPAYAAEAERLAELGWLERAEYKGELAGYRLSAAATSH